MSDRARELRLREKAECEAEIGGGKTEVWGLGGCGGWGGGGGHRGMCQRSDICSEGED